MCGDRDGVGCEGLRQAGLSPARGISPGARKAKNSHKLLPQVVFACPLGGSITASKGRHLQRAPADAETHALG